MPRWLPFLPSVRLWVFLCVNLSSHHCCIAALQTAQMQVCGCANEAGNLTDICAYCSGTQMGLRAQFLVFEVFWWWDDLKYKIISNFQNKVSHQSSKLKTLQSKQPMKKNPLISSLSWLCDWENNPESSCPSSVFFQKWCLENVRNDAREPNDLTLQNPHLIKR